MMAATAKKITAINRDTVHKICSGQVVLNLATAVKELLENSLDAGATIIEIRLKEYGSELIEVSDNGKGIHPEDFEALALKHHTSKIRDFGDLVDVETFGFRGEALSSLCAVGQMTVTTRHGDEECGSQLKFDHRGVLMEKKPFPRQVGTTVKITNLFSSLPVRQKEFHRNVKKEFSKTVQLLSAYCLISNNVKISCVNQTKKGSKTTFLSTQENKNLRENISCVFGSKQLTNLLEITKTYLDNEIVDEYGIKNAIVETFQLSGYISSCEHGNGRSTTDRQFYYINSRPCELAKVMKVTNEVYHRYNLHQYPFVLLNITVPKESVDVNVTPDKRLIFLENEKLLLACVKSTLIKLFENIPSTYKINVPVSVMPTSYSSTSTDNKVTNRNSLLDVNKWRHTTDRNTKQETTMAQKRCLSQQFQSSSNSKQLKLDHVFKITNVREKSVIDEVASEESQLKMADLSPIKKEVSKNTHTFLELQEYCDNEKSSGSISNEDHISAETEILVDTEVDDEYTTNMKNFSDTVENCLKSEPPPESYRMSRKDCEIESKLEDETCNSDEHEFVLTKFNSEGNSRMIQIFDDTPQLKSDERNQRGIINTSIDTLRKSASDRRDRRKNNADVTNKFHIPIDPNKNQNAEEELKKEISKSMFKQMKIVGQFNLGFIITKLENDLFIVDQHATDEKYNFETLQRNTVLKNQKLISPQDLNLTATNECILIDNIEILRKNGFEFLVDPSAEATKRVKLISIPVSANWQFGKEDIDEMLFMLQDAPNTLCRPSRIRAMFASRACRRSVMIGSPLSFSDMRRLINNMGTIEQPWNCPHGRPTMRHLVNLSLLN